MVDPEAMSYHTAIGSISNHFNTEIHSTSVAEPGPQSLMAVQVRRWISGKGSSVSQRMSEIGNKLTEEMFYDPGWSLGL